ncbi:MAG: multicopper oxidase domain-containing protein [Burkholderiaceae bacterium]|nr:multicopper oxidase domain-containing protein [Burkholderiaceae bacterium]
MQSSSSNRIRRGKALRLGLALLTSGLTLLLPSGAAQAAGPAVGVACTTSASPNPTFTLNATDGYIQLPDSNTMYMWGYAQGGAAFQHPGPVLCVNQGDTVTVILNNSLPEDVSIIFPGQEAVQANGAPAQPQFNSTGTLTSLTDVAAAGGGGVSYTFVATHPGSFLYESGTNPQKQVRMGLFGALLVRPAMGPNFVYNRADSQFTPQEDFMVLLSELDPYQHEAAERNQSFNLNNYHPRYWLINGRGFPDSISDNFSPFLPDQPYGALARIHPFDTISHPYPGAIHYLNVGTEEFPFHPHGNNGLVIGRDGRPLEGPTGQDLSFEKFAINIGPGQTWDVIFKWYDAENYSEANPVPVTIPQVNNQEFGMFYSGSPYLGKTGPLPPGASTLNTCGEYYIISHNHALFQITSWGVNMSGPITYVRVDPPLPNNCQ